MNRLLVLDMDETLLHTEVFPTEDFIEEGCYDFKFELEGKWYFVNKRPFLEEFIKWAFQNFKVAIWTAGSSDYATECISISGIEIDKLEFFWTRERCVGVRDQVYGDYYNKKPLLKVKKLGWDLEKVLIVDDFYKSAEDNWGNLIRISEFISSNSNTELLKLINYLDEIKEFNNYRSIDKRGWSNK